MSLFTKIKNRSKWLCSFPKGFVERIIYPAPKIAGIEETLNKIISLKASMSRYGDGEYNLMFGNDIDFQTYDKRLDDKMRAILKTDDDTFLVGVPDEMYHFDNLRKDTVKFWKTFVRYNRKKIAKLLVPDKQYYWTSITRFYFEFIDKSKCGHYVELLKKIWDDRDIVFIEGDKSRLGVGNDLFDNAKSVRRILCPAVEAFGVYDEIIEKTKALVEKDALILIALGPTATALAYDLYKEGYQAIDIGHVDIEYEWMLRGATTKIAIENKYVNENDDGGKIVGDIHDETYLSQIIAKIGV